MIRQEKKKEKKKGFSYQKKKKKIGRGFAWIGFHIIKVALI